jgi:hypothetical protein
MSHVILHDVRTLLQFWSSVKVAQMRGSSFFLPPNLMDCRARIAPEIAELHFVAYRPAATAALRRRFCCQRWNLFFGALKWI